MIQPEFLQIEIADGVAVVTMNAPPVNAQNRQLQDEIAETFDYLSDDEDVRAVVFTGAGKVFSAGADIKARGSMPKTGGAQRQHLRSARESYYSILECKKPVICAINGAALGAGLALVASCDILIASENASLGLPEVTIGLMGGGRHAQRLFGHSRLRRMMLTGYRVSGAELYRLGVVEACVKPADLMETAMGIAREIAALSPVSTQFAKHALNTIEELTLRDGYRFEQEMTMQIGKTADAKEAMQAFVEKRKPVFVGR